MSLMGMGEGPSHTPGQELERFHVSSDLDVIHQTAASLVESGVEEGVIDAGLVKFASGVLGESGTEAALILPIYPLVAAHTILASAQNPDTRAETLYSVHLRDGKPESLVNEYRWTKAQSGNPARYEGRGAVGTLHMSGSNLLATSKEALDNVIQWEDLQRTSLVTLEASGPLGRATALVESAFGGIPVSDPERAVRELSARMLTAALLERQHVTSTSLTSLAHDPNLIEPRLSRLFHLEHSDAFREFVSKVDSVAKLSTVGGAIEASRVQVMNSMLNEDTARFLETVWPDLERMIEIERLGRTDVGRVLNVLTKR